MRMLSCNQLVSLVGYVLSICLLIYPETRAFISSLSPELRISVLGIMLIVPMTPYSKEIYYGVLRRTFPKHPPIYIIALKDVGTHWVANPKNVVKTVKRLAKRHKVEVIRSLVELDMFVREPPRKPAVVINAHGEVMPVPLSWNSGWKQFLIALANNVKVYGWVFTSIVGYPFFYYAQDTTLHETSGNLGHMGENGLNLFLSVIGASANCRRASVVTLTMEGQKAAEDIGTTLPTSTNAARCAVWTNVKTTKIFYTGHLLGASAISIGNGFLIHNGLTPSDLGSEPSDITDHFLAQASAAFAFAVMKDFHQ